MYSNNCYNCQSDLTSNINDGLPVCEKCYQDKKNKGINIEMLEILYDFKYEEDRADETKDLEPYFLYDKERQFLSDIHKNGYNMLSFSNIGYMERYMVVNIDDENVILETVNNTNDNDILFKERNLI